jgi:hypothetical protein
MKKLFYILLFAFTTSVAISSCTEEEVKPATETDNGGGAVNDPIKR